MFVSWFGFFHFYKMCIRDRVSTLPRSTFAKQLITQAVSQLNSLSETLALIRQQMLSLASEMCIRDSMYTATARD